jgi:hypothetical protein
MGKLVILPTDVPEGTTMTVFLYLYATVRLRRALAAALCPMLSL